MLAIHQAQIEVLKRFLFTPDLADGHAALLCCAPQDRLSFKGALDAAQEYSRAMDKIPARQRRRRRSPQVEEDAGQGFTLNRYNRLMLVAWVSAR
jgi:hypothetical protein